MGNIRSTTTSDAPAGGARHGAQVGGDGTWTTIAPSGDTVGTDVGRTCQADLVLTKTNTPGVNGEVDQPADTVTSGSTTSYTITLSNAGARAADGAVLQDPAPTGVTCSTATCTASGGAVCPAQTGAALVTALQGAGVPVPTLPASGSVTVTLVCAVP